MATRRSTTSRIYTLRVELEGIEPLIWRRLEVPAAITLPKLHRVLQVVMGWTDSHLHSFRIGDREYSNAGDLDELNMLDVKGHKLDALLGDTIRDMCMLGVQNGGTVGVESGDCRYSRACWISRWRF